LPMVLFPFWLVVGGIAPGQRVLGLRIEVLRDYLAARGWYKERSAADLDRPMPLSGVGDCEGCRACGRSETTR
jgi:hypothetical protein